MPTRARINSPITYSAASIHCTGGSTLFYNKRSPTPDEKYLLIGDGNKMEVEFLFALM